MQKVVTFRARAGATTEVSTNDYQVIPIPPGTAIIHVSVDGGPARVHASEFNTEPTAWGFVTNKMPLEIRLTFGREKFLHVRK